MVALLQDLINTPDIRVGIVSRNVTIEPEQTLAIVLRRHGIDSDQLDFIKCIPLGDGKAPQFRRIREKYGINPLRTYVCGDEYHDYSEANATGLQSIIASYGFEDYQRLVESFNIPPEVIAKTPAEMANRLRHALDLQLMD
jgi:phosphoglycolate phosphatase